MGILGCRAGHIGVVGIQGMWGLVGWQGRGLRIVVGENLRCVGVQVFGYRGLRSRRC